MKAIISHDVDHITTREHWKDLTIPKFLVRTIVEKIRGGITLSEIGKRLHETFVTGKWQNIDEIMKFDHEHGVQSSFFIGVNRGLGLSYSQRQAAYWIKKISNHGFDVGVHGICFDDQAGINREHDAFSQISGLQSFGIRMHYLRKSPQTLKLLSEAGYLYDATGFDFASPFRVGTMIEFPLQIREANMLYPYSTFYTVRLDEAISLSKKKIELADKMQLPYLTVLFHDRYFSSAFKVWKEWYTWLINYLHDGGIQFIDYQKAVKEDLTNFNILE